MACVFLSYAGPDKPAVRRLDIALRAAGHDTWFDENQILVGESIFAAVARGLRDADFVVICLSNAAADRGWVEAERDATLMQQFRERKVRLLPVRLEDVAPPLFIAPLAYVDLFPDEQAFTDGIARLTRSIEGHEARQAGRQPRPRVDPDSDIVSLVAHDDMTGALRCLMRRHGRSVYLYCREALLDPALAEDVHQQVFLDAFRGLSRFRGHYTVRTRLFAIARHRVLDATMVRRRARSHNDDRDAPNMPNTRLSPEQRLDDARLQETLTEGLDKLPAHELAAVLLRFQQGFTFEDMATICDEKPGTLEARVMRAMSKLRTCIERRIEDALVRLGAEHEPPPGWEARVLAATHVTRRRRWWYAVGGLAAAAAVQTILIYGRPAVDHESAATIAADVPGWITKR